MKKCSKTRYK